MPLLYQLELSPSLHLQIEERGKKRVLYLDTLKGLAESLDLPPLTLLIDLHLKGRTSSTSPETLSFNRIELKGGKVAEILHLLAKTERLFFQKTKIASGKSGKGKLFWRGEKLSELSSFFSPFFQSEKGIVPFESLGAHLPTSPPLALFEGELFELSPPFPLSWLALFSKGPLLLEGAKRKKFLEEEPPILWAEAKVSPPIEPLPLLHLTDANGCFARLFFDYPTLGIAPLDDLNPLIGKQKRNRSAEAQLEKDLLESGFERRPNDCSSHFCPSDRVTAALTLLLEVGWRLFDYKKREVLLPQSTSLAIRSSGAFLSIEGECSFEGGAAPLSHLAQAAREGRRWLELDIRRTALINPKQLPFLESTLPKERPADLAPLLDRPFVDWEEGLRSTLEKLEARAPLATTPPSPSFQGTLLPYQQKGVDWLHFLHRSRLGALLADEMGLGKTVQVLAFFSQLGINLPTFLPVLILAPTSLLFHWQREIERFLPAWSVSLYRGGPLSSQKAHCYLTSYTLLRQGIEHLAPLFFEVVLLDESQAIKTAASQTAQAACRLQANFRICLNGTPVENRPEELWSQFHFLLPPLLGELSQFQKAPLAALKRKVAPFLLRRKKEEVAIDLPEKIEQIVWIEMEPAQRALYESYRQGVEAGILRKVAQDGFAACRIEVLEAILRLRQIAADPRLLPSNLLGLEGKKTEGGKLLRLLEEIELSLEEGRKILIYSQFTQMLRLIEEALKDRGHPYLTLDGSTDPSLRGKLVATFQEGKTPLFLLSLKAGGVGLTLTAADTVILFDPWWNEAVENQAIDRVHRIGQKRGVLAKRYLAPDTVEEKMLSLKAKKRELAKELLSLDEEPLSWGEMDWLHLLS